MSKGMFLALCLSPCILTYIMGWVSPLIRRSRLDRAQRLDGAPVRLAGGRLVPSRQRQQQVLGGSASAGRWRVRRVHPLLPCVPSVFNVIALVVGARERQAVDSAENSSPTGPSSKSRLLVATVALLSTALACGACESGPVVECADDEVPKVGFYRRQPWTPSERPTDEWRQRDVDAVMKVMQLDAVVADPGDEQDGGGNQGPSRHTETVKSTATVLLYDAAHSREPPRSFDELVSVCEQVAGGLTAHDLLEEAEDVCEGGGRRGFMLMMCAAFQDRVDKASG